MDIRDASATFSFLQQTQPDLIIHAAALTGVRRCEEDRELCWETNVGGTRNLVEGFQKLGGGGLFAYISTACVFQGDRGMYSESDLPYPKNFYALTKLLGEQIVIDGARNHLIIRTNFVPRGEWPYPRAFTDRFGTYLFADQTAAGIRELVDAGLKGTVHLTGDRRISMYELARMVDSHVLPVTLADYKGPPLTVDMSLDTKTWKKYTLMS